MDIRLYDPGKDFDVIKDWITDRRSHALWCADRVSFPLRRDEFDRLLTDEYERFGNKAYISVNGGRTVGFFCISRSGGSSEAMLKFIMVAPDERGRGIGTEMLKTAVFHAFGVLGADTVELCVFSANAAARRCYGKAGFEEIHTDPAAFVFGEEKWDRCIMQILRKDTTHWQK